jgi:hypothetical protein
MTHNGLPTSLTISEYGQKVAKDTINNLEQMLKR